MPFMPHRQPSPARIASVVAVAAVFAMGLAPSAPAQTGSRPITDLFRTGVLKQGDASAGMKEALRLGAEAASARLARKDGYFGDGAVRIPLPGVLGDAQKQLKSLGLAKPLDDLQLSINRAAEATAPAAGKLVADAVKGMSVEDAVGIVRGKDTAATEYLRGKTETQLRAAFRPAIEKALTESGALAQAEKAVSRYGAGLVKESPRKWILDASVSGAMDGMFYYLAKEEQAIRKDPARRTSEILRRVFGG
jgi:hypothetical protein